MPSLSERTVVLSIGKTVKGLAYLAFSVGTARLYALTDYAAFQAWWTVYMLLVPIAEGGFTASLYHALPRLAQAERNGLVWRTFVVLCGLGAAAAAGTVLLAAPIAAWFDLPNAHGQLIAVAGFIGAALPTFALQAWLLVEGRTAAVAWLDIVGAAVTGAALFVPALAGASPELGLWLLSGYGLTRTLVLGAWMSARLRPRNAPADLGEQLAYAGHVSVSRALGVATKQIDRFFVGGLAGPQAFSIYATGALEIPLIGVLTGSAATVMAPEISRRFHDGDRRGALTLWHESIRKISLLLFPVGAAAAVLAGPLFLALYGADFAAAALIFQIFLLALPLRAAQYGAVLLAAGDSGRVVRGSLGGLVLAALLCVWWVPAYAGAGAAFAGVVSVYAIVLYYLPGLAKHFACGVAELFPWSALGRVALACLPAALAAYTALLLAEGAWTRLLVGGGLFAGAFVPAALVVGAVRKEDRARLERYLTRRQHA